MAYIHTHYVWHTSLALVLDSNNNLSLGTSQSGAFEKPSTSYISKPSKALSPPITFGERDKDLPFCSSPPWKIYRDLVGHGWRSISKFLLAVLKSPRWASQSQAAWPGPRPSKDESIWSTQRACSPLYTPIAFRSLKPGKTKEERGSLGYSSLEKLAGLQLVFYQQFMRAFRVEGCKNTYTGLPACVVRGNWVRI